MKQTLTYDVAGLNYLVHPQILVCSSSALPVKYRHNADDLDQGSILENGQGDEPVPVVVIGRGHDTLNFSVISAKLAHFEAVDDVFSAEFGKVLIVASSRTSVKGLASYQKVEPIIYHLDSEVSAVANGSLPDGPYFLRGRNLHQAWRLYPDELEAFSFGVVPESATEPRKYE